MHENVPEMSLAFFRAALEDLYIIVTMIIDINALGWPGIRERRITLFLLRELVLCVVSPFDTYVHLCARQCLIGWWHFMVMTDEVLQ